MKYVTGDCLAFRLTDGRFLAGIIFSINLNRYDVVLTDYNQPAPPSSGYFSDCLLFGIDLVLDTRSFTAVNTITIEPAYADQAQEIARIANIGIPGTVNSSGFTAIANLAELASYFEAGMQQRSAAMQKQAKAAGEFEIKCFTPIREFLEGIRLPNSFPTVKLYKQTGDSILYWQIHGNDEEPAYLVISRGRLGHTGEFTEINDQPVSELKQIYQAEIAALKQEGYREAETLHPMILQFPTGDTWGAIDDLDFRNEIWEELDRALYWTGNGSVSGGDIGSGTVNLFFEAIDPAYAVAIIKQVLEERKTDRPYLIALEPGSDEEIGDNGLPIVKVLYPEDYTGLFSY